MDRGASYQIYSHIGLFHGKPEKAEDATFVRIREGSTIEARYQCDVKLVLTTGYGDFNVYLRDVLYVPQAGANLPPVPQAENNGYAVLFKNNELCIYHIENNAMALRAKRNGNGYNVRACKVAAKIMSSAMIATTVTNVNGSFTWHRRFGHPGRTALDQGMTNDYW